MSQEDYSLLTSLGERLQQTLAEGHQHNDVKIILDDGEVHVNKFLMSVGSEYFSAMFNDQSKFEESDGTVKVACKKIVMEKLVKLVYGGNLDIKGLKLLEVVELLEMLRMTLMEGAFKFLEKKILDEFISVLKIENYEMFNEVSVVLKTALVLKLNEIRYRFCRAPDPFPDHTTLSPYQLSPFS